MAWVKKQCYVITAFYQEKLYLENETPISEEFIRFSYDEAIKCKVDCENNDDYETVMLDEDTREFWE